MITETLRPSWLEVHLPSLWQNLLALRPLDPHVFCCPMVKANAYGHGAIPLIKFLSKKGLGCFGFALYEEAIEAHEALPSLSFRSLVFSPIVENCIHQIEKYSIEPVVGSLFDLQMLDQHASRDIKVHLKINLGMQRLGVAPKELSEGLELIKNSKFLHLQGLCSHLPCYEDYFSPQSTSQKQEALFLQIVKEICPPESHLLNSAGLIASKMGDNYPIIGSRPGIALYGCTPCFQECKIDISKHIKLVSPLKLKTKVCLIRHISKGEGVSYGPTWRSSQDSIIGVLPIGYADGIRRCFSGKIHVEIRGIKVPIIGTVCMDYCMVDLTDVPTAQEGDIVSIINSSEDIENMALAAGTISYEILTGLGPRIPRLYIEE